MSIAYDPYVGEIRPFTGEPPERSWLPCDGRRLLRRQYEPLFYLLGTRFGGEGDYFNLPDLRGRVPAGTDPRPKRSLGDTSGSAAEPAEAIPYEVVNWAICIHGVWPQAAS